MLWIVCLRHLNHHSFFLATKLSNLKENMAGRQNTPPASVKNINFPPDQASRLQKKPTTNWVSLMDDLSRIFLPALQYSSLENPKERGTWWPTVHRVAKSWVPLQHLSSTEIHQLYKMHFLTFKPFLECLFVCFSQLLFICLWPESAL